MKHKTSSATVGLLVLVAAVSFSSCSTAPYSGRKQLMLLPESQMEALGMQSFDAMLQQTPTTTDPNVVQYAECVTQPIVDTVTKRGDGPKSWRIAVFKDESPNAFALPGGNIGVHTGIFKVAKNNAQLATVLGHELGHVIANHSGERMSQTLATQGGMSLVGSFLSGKLDSTKSNLLMSALGLGAQVGILLPFSREQETEADIVGLHLMAESGYDPKESVALWKNMMAATEGNAPPKFLSTHPPSNERIDRLNLEIPKVLADYEKEKSSRKPASGACSRPSDSILIGGK